MTTAKMTRLSIRFAVTLGSGEQAAELFAGAHLLDAKRHGGNPVRHPVVAAAPRNLPKRCLENLLEAMVDLGFGPEQLLQVLHPFEIRNDDAARIAQNVGDHEYLVLALVENG